VKERCEKGTVWGIGVVKRGQLEKAGVGARGRSGKEETKRYRLQKEGRCEVSCVHKNKSSA
jgi:hypothetical protein